MPTDLKPCPFCGGEAHFEMDESRWEWIECASCGLQGNRSASLMDDCKPKLAEAWNRRSDAILADAQAEIARLRGALEKSHPANYRNGVLSDNKVTLFFHTVESADAWFEGFMDRYDTALK